MGLQVLACSPTWLPKYEPGVRGRDLEQAESLIEISAIVYTPSIPLNKPIKLPYILPFKELGPQLT